MKCAMCKRGETKPGVTSVLLTRDNFTLVMRDVPAEICDICGEDYIDGEIAKNLYHMAEKMQKQGTLLDVRKYQYQNEPVCATER
ncbi:type II toxin-antitoxin system MqsA family antitoxin [Methanospirillum hungatei]|uniref:type II toxin-antitoxin system MqsA family antitoxin n=1 Tax=Methanospirillum hungatei TaxID=2203 RepID=UPI0026EB67F6|nr:type II toxin-antitoxin system MqsA family antitoxin [Methanospirillum hungatei]MCA1915850.1 type II toxin-antitoxin system MqsA family antitoxin [Methanospirillum hungatei]